MSEEKAAYPVGTTVRLKSGGAIMTINDHYYPVNDSDYPFYVCVWHTSKGKRQQADYHEKALIPILAVTP